MKSTTLFGGVQVFNILFAVIRSKVIAMLLGPTGMGIAGLLTATTGIVTNLTNLGIGTSAVKDIAQANSTGDENRIIVVVSVFRRLVWITGLLGTFIVLICSPILSQMTFGNKDYTIAFVWLSVTLLFSQLTSGQMVLLQGMRKLQYLAKADVAGTILGFCISAPLYFWFGVDGIVPAMIITSLSLMGFAFYWGNKVKIKSIATNLPMIVTEGGSMFKMGIMLSLSGLIASLTAYILRIFISQKGGVDEVGLFNAGFAVINTYVGMIFTAMGTDYYPRLSAVEGDNEKVATSVNQQAEISILILAPILIGFLTFINIIVNVLYSDEFLAINDMVLWASLGMFFKAISWALGFIILAKGAVKVFFWNELLTNTYFMCLNLAGYHFGGLTGLGISFFISYCLHFLQMYFLTKKNYEFVFNSQFVKIFIVQFSLGISCFLLVKILPANWGYLAGSVLLLSSGLYSYYHLDKLLDIKALIVKFKNKFKRNG